MTVTNGIAEFEVTDADVTNDLDVVEQLERDAAPPAVADRPPSPTAPPPAIARPVAAPATPDAAKIRAEQRDRISGQISHLNQSISGYNQKLRALNDQQYKGLKSFHGSIRASQLARDRNTPEESRVNALLQKAEAQRDALQQQLRNLR